MTGKTIAILGLGRSGVSAAKAALKAGARPMVFDEKPVAGPGKLAAADELRAHGVPVEADWDGAFIDTGVDLIVTSPGVPMRHPKLQRAVEEGLEVIGEIELAYRISKAPIVAITGTNGKSTTTVMTWLCLKAAGVDTALCGNIYGSGYPETTLTDAASESRPDQVLVAEISSFQLEFIKDFRPVAAAITTLAEDHLNRYKNFDEYATMKRRIFRNMGAGCTAVWNLDEPATRPPANEGMRIWAYSGADQHGPPDIAQAYETRDTLHVFGEDILKSSLPWTEPHNHRNAMCAALLAIAALGDPSPDKVKAAVGGLGQFKALSHRLHRVGVFAGVTIINNSMCTNPQAVIASSIAVGGTQRLLMGGENKHLHFSEVGEHLRSHGHTAYVYGRDAASIASELDTGAKVFGTLREAFEAAVSDAQPGDNVMLAPGVASTDQFADFRDRGDRFVEMALEWGQSRSEGG